MKAIDPILEIKPLRTKGSTENEQLRQAGDIDMGLVSGEVPYEWAAAIPARQA